MGFYRGFSAVAVSDDTEGRRGRHHHKLDYLEEIARHSVSTRHSPLVGRSCMLLSSTEHWTCEWGRSVWMVLSSFGAHTIETECLATLCQNGCVSPDAKMYCLLANRISNMCGSGFACAL